MRSLRESNEEHVALEGQSPLLLSVEESGAWGHAVPSPACLQPRCPIKALVSHITSPSCSAGQWDLCPSVLEGGRLTRCRLSIQVPTATRAAGSFHRKGSASGLSRDEAGPLTPWQAGTRISHCHKPRAGGSEHRSSRNVRFRS